MPLNTVSATESKAATDLANERSGRKSRHKALTSGVMAESHKAIHLNDVIYELTKQRDYFILRIERKVEPK